MQYLLRFDESMRERYGDTCFGVLTLRDFSIKPGCAQAFAALVRAEVALVREQHRDFDKKQLIESDPAIGAYVRYYKKFKKTYHVLPQLASILSGKPFPDTLPLVQILFLTELRTSLLIAGHDLGKIALPMTMHMARGGEGYVGASGDDVTLKSGDICIRDRDSYILSIIYGQDEKTRIGADTRDVFFLIDGVPGLEEARVREGLALMLAYVRTLDPDISPECMRVVRCCDVG